MKALLAVAALLCAGCATNCNTVRTSKSWAPVSAELAEVREANAASADAGLTHHTISYGPVSWYRRANGDLYRCERLEAAATLTGDPKACSVTGVYLARRQDGWSPSLGVTSRCR
jgi:hypothetical protein